MAGRVFVDSNIVLYAFFRDYEKKLAAEAVLSAGNIVISSQVVGEVCVNLRKKAGFSGAEIGAVASALYGQFEVAEIKREDFLVSASLMDRFSFSYWDSLIVAAALNSGCSILYSEDMQDGLKIENMLIRNPF